MHDVYRTKFIHETQFTAQVICDLIDMTIILKVILPFLTVATLQDTIT